MFEVLFVKHNIFLGALRFVVTYFDLFLNPLLPLDAVLLSLFGRCRSECC